MYASPSIDTASQYADAIKATGRRAWVYEVEPTGETITVGAEARSRHPFRVLRRLSAVDIEKEKGS